MILECQIFYLRSLAIKKYEKNIFEKSILFNNYFHLKAAPPLKITGHKTLDIVCKVKYAGLQLVLA